LESEGASSRSRAPGPWVSGVTERGRAGAARWSRASARKGGVRQRRARRRSRSLNLHLFLSRPCLPVRAPRRAALFPLSLSPCSLACVSALAGVEKVERVSLMTTGAPVALFLNLLLHFFTPSLPLVYSLHTPAAHAPRTRTLAEEPPGLENRSSYLPKKTPPFCLSPPHPLRSAPPPQPRPRPRRHSAPQTPRSS